MNKKNYLYLILLIAGIGSLVYAGYSGLSISTLEKNANKTPAHIIDYEVITKKDGHSEKTVYYPIIEFETKEEDNLQFTSKIGSSARTYAIGENINIIYDPSNPENAVIDTVFDKYFPIIIITLIGIMFLLSSIYLLKLDYINPRRRARLMAEGELIKARITRIVVSTRTNNRPSSWKIEATAEIYNKKYTFFSEDLKQNPTSFIDPEGQYEIPVWIDKNNPKKYYMDTLIF